MNLWELMTLSDVFSFGVNSILQCSSDAQSFLYGEIEMLFDIPLIGLIKAVRFEGNSFHGSLFYLENKLGAMLPSEQ